MDCYASAHNDIFDNFLIAKDAVERPIWSLQQDGVNAATIYYDL